MKDDTSYDKEDKGTLLSFTNECTGLSPSQTLDNLDIYYYKRIYDKQKRPKQNGNDRGDQ